MKSLGENISLRKLLEAFTLPSPGEAGNASFLSPYVCPLESGSSGLEMTDSWKIQRPEEAKAIHLRGWNKEDRIENKSYFCQQKGSRCIHFLMDLLWVTWGDWTWGHLNKDFAPEVPLEG